VSPPLHYSGPASEYYARVCATLFAEPVR
jgi:hypothetical protein